ncbi:MAG: IS982 family transposase [Herpetosiphonaceae bacterium]|nr:IS982 family transposase [Herpetosiphonaceae bacterium]
MIRDFDDFCTWMYVVVDTLWQPLAPRFARPGPAPQCSDSELITMFVIGECRGWDVETELLNQWQAHRDLFPHIPSQSRANRRRRQLMLGINLVRQAILQLLDLAQDRQCAIDSLPIPAIHFHSVPGSNGEWKAHGATYGKVSSKQQTIFGYKLQLLVTLNGVIVDFELAPANAADLVVGLELLAEHSSLTVVGDKAYISGDAAEALAQDHQITLVTSTRKNQHHQASAATNRLINGARQIIETVNGQLSEQLHIERNHAHTFWGLCARLYTKLAAHTLCIYLNRLLGNSEALQIKALAFPN